MATLSLHKKRYTPQQAPNKTHSPFLLGRAPWWVPAVPAAQRDGKRKISFAEALKDFLRNVSFHCYGKLVEPHRRFHERFFWIIFHITMMSVMIVFLWRTPIFEGQFLSTTMFDPLYPIHKVPFPTISICTLNRMSSLRYQICGDTVSASFHTPYMYIDQNLIFKNLKNIFLKLYLFSQQKDPYKRGVNYFYHEIRKLSFPYSKATEKDENYEDFLEFQNFLDIYDTTDSEVFFNTRDRMKQLTPNCKDILVRCRLAGEDFDCLTKFTETLTANGFCCTFNDDGLYSKPRPQSLSFYEELNGLVLLLNSSNNDEYFKASLSASFAFYIHSYGHYADIASGSVKERYVESGKHTYMAIKPGIIETVNEARILPPSVFKMLLNFFLAHFAKRQCYFGDEKARIFGKLYSYNSCITRCRMYSILVLCNCLLFMHPNELLDVSTEYVYCTLRHKACLDRYYFKWSNVITERENIPGLEREMEDSLYCPQCLPMCSSERYVVHANALPLTSYNMRTFPDIDAENLSNFALTHVYFGVSHIQIFRRVLKDTWFEVLSFIGNIVSIITGFSLVGICEVLYFICRQLFLAFKSELASERKTKKQKAKTDLIILP
ncbi:LOW QUALITY PROTEIN: sodium channel protein Nach [Bactrocera dorsalis]|uniref:LOW QUALITY PROTEIN: sodium channel protein Nach n=1 Tax=Bactrocera dorsalis TaxID=27457 RepID=A0ABM3J893_BACDO|nr:LOW QUALITY PROTEIN: sodium channel protein Nach [Bactrocera dorsalis]